MRVVDGSGIAAGIRERTAAEVTRLTAGGVTPRLAVVVPTEDESTAWYVRSIGRAAERVGIDCQVHEVVGASGPEIADRLSGLSADSTVDGVSLQTPLPAGVEFAEMAGHIAPDKDVDGANPTSIGRLAAGLPTYAPATASAVVAILEHEAVGLEGASVVIVGRSLVVGKPAALLLMARNATVTVCHSRTKELAEVCGRADVLVAAVGRPRFIGAGHVKRGAVVIDVGTNPGPDGTLIGDVDAEAVGDLASVITPVPGGVGPVTTQILLRNTVAAAAARAELRPGTQ
jgi:methylenetetrahydrofolate dehydrogenase (NADP+) / methenyltetrahydrofolate cyclohydrolase